MVVDLRWESRFLLEEEKTLKLRNTRGGGTKGPGGRPSASLSASRRSVALCAGTHLWAAAPLTTVQGFWGTQRTGECLGNKHHTLGNPQVKVRPEETTRERLQEDAVAMVAERLETIEGRPPGRGILKVIIG